MASAPTSIYASTKGLLVAHPGQYFTSEAVRDALKLKDSNKAGADLEDVIDAC